MKLYRYSFDGGYHDPIVIVLALNEVEADKLVREKIDDDNEEFKLKEVYELDKSGVVYFNYGGC